MCYYDQMKYSCGHHGWGKFRRYCNKALAVANRALDTVNVAELAECSKKQVYKHIYDPQGRICRGCREFKPDKSEVDTKYRLQDVGHGKLDVFDLGLLENYPCWLQAGPVLGLPWQWYLGRDALRTYKGVPADNENANFGEFEATLLRNVAARFVSIVKARERKIQRLNLIVLRSLGVSNQSAFPDQNPKHQFALRLAPVAPPWKSKHAKLQVPLSPSILMKTPGLPYTKLNISKQQVRLFELYPSKSTSVVSGSFRYVELVSCSHYVALSYAWGDQASSLQVHIAEGGTISVRQNLWWFLRIQSTLITQPKLFWIDAICINQSDLVERNFQVRLMKLIYANAEEVYAWLGREANNSDLAMDFVAKRGAKSLRTRGPGFYSLWTREQGRALYEICERQYWRRMWIIQEIIHAEKITVWCGTKSFPWASFESLYLNLKTIEDRQWAAHHAFVMEVSQSSAGVMVWQRAYWRHPETPVPRLQMLIEIFRDWQCSDVRDKVYALVGMASKETYVVPNYRKSVREVYFAVLKRHGGNDPGFYSLLSQVLGLPGKDIMLPGQDLIEFKRHPPEKLVLRKRVMDDEY